MSLKYKAEQVAQWMVAEIEQQQLLEQETAINYILKHFGEDFTYINKNGNLSIAKPVLREFKKLHGGHMVWNQSEWAWHRENKK